MVMTLCQNALLALYASRGMIRPLQRHFLPIPSQIKTQNLQSQKIIFV